MALRAAPVSRWRDREVELFREVVLFREEVLFARPRAAAFVRDVEADEGFFREVCFAEEAFPFVVVRPDIEID